MPGKHQVLSTLASLSPSVLGCRLFPDIPGWTLRISVMMEPQKAELVGTISERVLLSSKQFSSLQRAQPWLFWWLFDQHERTSVCLLRIFVHLMRDDVTSGTYPSQHVSKKCSKLRFSTIEINTKRKKKQLLKSPWFRHWAVLPFEFLILSRPTFLDFSHEVCIIRDCLAS